jgi:hypothetical protein
MRPAFGGGWCWQPARWQWPRGPEPSSSSWWAEGGRGPARRRGWKVGRVREKTQDAGHTLRTQRHGGSAIGVARGSGWRGLGRRGCGRRAREAEAYLFRQPSGLCCVCNTMPSAGRVWPPAPADYQSSPLFSLHSRTSLRPSWSHLRCFLCQFDTDIISPDGAKRSSASCPAPRFMHVQGHASATSPQRHPSGRRCLEGATSSHGRGDEGRQWRLHYSTEGGGGLAPCEAA